MEISSTTNHKLTTNIMSSVPQPSGIFYRRPLRPPCIDLCSAEGRELFKTALEDGLATGYFRVASQFHTQAEPSFCGLATLVVVLNGLEIDPHKAWKGVWRFYDESMLDCCVSLDKIKEVGMNLQQFHCLATCNALTSDLKYGSSVSLEVFRADVIQSVQSDDQVLAVNYDRSVLNQTGTGHFSPIGAFHKERDLVLLLDTARFKYPPHWVPLSLLHAAMQTIDPSSHKDRGYSILRRSPECLMLFGVRETINVFEIDGQARKVLAAWMQWARQEGGKGVLGEYAEYMKEKVPFLMTFDGSALDSRPDRCCVSEDRERYRRAYAELRRGMERTTVFETLRNEVCGTKCEIENCDDQCPPLTSAHLLLMFLLSWTFPPNDGPLSRGLLLGRIKEELEAELTENGSSAVLQEARVLGDIMRICITQENAGGT